MLSWPSKYRLQAYRLYKELHYLGREYPDPNYDFHGKLRRLFERNRTLTNNENDIQRSLALADHIKNETLALYSLKKYRHLRRSYPDS